MARGGVASRGREQDCRHCAFRICRHHGDTRRMACRLSHFRRSATMMLVVTCIASGMMALPSVAEAQTVRTPYYCADDGCSKYFYGAFWYFRGDTYVRLDSVRYKGSIGLDNAGECSWSHQPNSNYPGGQAWQRRNLWVRDGDGTSPSTIINSPGVPPSDAPAGAVFDNCTFSSVSTYPTGNPYGPVQTHTERFFRYNDILVTSGYRLYEGSPAQSTLLLQVTDREFES